MNITELIQLIRTCNLSQVRAELEASGSETLRIVEQFYLRAKGRKP